MKKEYCIEEDNKLFSNVRCNLGIVYDIIKCKSVFKVFKVLSIKRQNFSKLYIELVLINNVLFLKY